MQRGGETPLGQGVKTPAPLRCAPAGACVRSIPYSPLHETGKNIDRSEG